MKDSQPVKIKKRKFKLNKSNSSKTKISAKPNNPKIKKEEDIKKPLEEKKESVLKQHKFNFQYVLILLIVLAIILIVMCILNILLKQKIENERIFPLQYTVNISSYPIMDKVTNPDISAKSAIIMDADSHTVLYSKNPELRFSMASTTKIMTALVAMDYYKDKSVLTIYSPRIEGSNIGFYQGEQFYFKDLLYAMMLPSSNEAAVAIAENYPGGKDAFVRKMNEKSQEFNLANTHFKDPVGLDDDNDYSNVLDLSRLSAIAMKNKELASIFATKHKTITDITGNNVYELGNLNKLLGEDGVNGIKTGTTEGAGEVLVTSTVANGHTFIIIVMKSTQRFVDTRILLSLINKNVHFINPQP